ncbi:STAS domain-containing protein [Streptomyces sp. NPDC014748]|uniref:STAS domain-containing protein n=1 Tax=unclassified Streptomyces TaxID=2593676 RepID=UPI001469FDB2|nr:STAS domain-containing protein [Streptomyces sp. GMY02]NMO34415.1 STAS domain-containing protein [Streptomyces sp. GMY02]
MTALPGDAFFHASAPDGAGVALIRITGGLDRITSGVDRDTAHELTVTAAALLGSGPPPRRPRLDRAGMTLCDSLGPAALLMVRREATAAGTRLHLDGRPAALRRLLDATGTALLLPEP